MSHLLICLLAILIISPEQTRELAKGLELVGVQTKSCKNGSNDTVTGNSGC